MRILAAHKVSTRGDVSSGTWHMGQEDAWPMGRDICDLGKTAISKRQKKKKKH